MSTKKRPSAKAFFTNLSGSEPLGKKLSLLLHNNAKIIMTRQNCWGIMVSPDADRVKRNSPVGERRNQEER